MLFSIAIAAAEAAVGLALIIAIYRHFRTTDLDADQRLERLNGDTRHVSWIVQYLWLIPVLPLLAAGLHCADAAPRHGRWRAGLAIGSMGGRTAVGCRWPSGTC